MDRQIVYPGAIPLDTDLLSTERNIMVAIGYLAQATLGKNIVAEGLVCSPTQPASLAVSVGPGCITQFGVVDTTPFGSLPAEPGWPLVRLATNLSSTSFALTAPSGPGEAINYLIEASLLETDATPVVLPYYNAANPAQPYSGPAGDGAPQNTQRLQQVQLQLKAGAPAAVGSQQTPAVDAGWAGLYVVTVQYQQSAVTAANIAVLPSAPFLSWKLPQLSPGTHNVAAFTPATQQAWTVPNGVSLIKLRIWGGGGAGGAGTGSGGGSGAGGGGAGGGYSEGYYAVSPGQSFFVTVGNGGVGSGTAGGASSFGTIASAAGGSAGTNGSAGAIGAGGSVGGGGIGSGFVVAGQPGGAGVDTGAFALSGGGGGAFGSPGGASVAAVTGGAASSGNSCTLGGGGGGGILSGVGGQGGPGLVLVEW